MERCRYGLLILLVLLFSSGSISASTPPLACEDPGQWLSVFLSPEIIVVVCSIIESGDPVFLELNGSTSEQVASELQDVTQQSGFPEDIKQQLVLWFQTWPQP